MYGQPPPGPQGPWGGYPPPQQQPYYPPHPQQVVVQHQITTHMVKAPFNHGVHIVLDLVTCGTWIPIHLICWAVH
jgi:hypothetical protein